MDTNLKSKYFLIILLPLMFSCSKDQTDDDIQEKIETGLTDEQLEYWESLGADTSIQASDLQFENGTPISNWLRVYEPGFHAQYGRSANDVQRGEINSLSGKLNSLVSMSEGAAEYFTIDDNFPELTGQTGISYVYGSHNHYTKSICSHVNDQKVNDCNCVNPYYGLDCSGFIYEVFQIAGLPLEPGSTYSYDKKETWQKAIDKSEKYKGLIVDRIADAKLTDLKVGDIVVNPGNHMGIVGMSKGYKKIFNSLGKWDKSCEINTSQGYGPIASPRQGKDIIAATLGSLFTEGKFNIIRFINPNTYYNGAVMQGPLAQYTLNGSPNYTGSMKVINLSLQAELSNNRSSVANAYYTYNISSPDIPGFYNLNIGESNTITNSSITNNHIYIQFGTTATFDGVITGNQISGNFNGIETYTDGPSHLVTNVIVSTPITLKLQ